VGRLTLAALASALSLASGCGSCRSSASSSSAAPLDADAAVELPVEAPVGVLARVWVRSADALWTRVQNGVGGAAALLPGDVGSMVCAGAGLDSAVAALVDGKSTAYAIVATPSSDDGGPASGASLAWSLALPLRDAARVASILMPTAAPSASSAPRVAVRDEQGMRVLSRSEPPLPMATALVRGWLLLASSDADLRRLAPYLWRTMPTLPPPSSSASIVAELEQGAVAARLAAGWAGARAWLAERDQEQRARHGGRPPDFGDPAAILDAVDAVVAKRMALLATARDASLTLDATEDAVDVDLQVSPGEDDAGWVSAMTLGDARPLADVSGDAIVALLSRGDRASRVQDADDAALALTSVLGAHVQAGDQPAIAAALRAWAQGRGDWLTVTIDGSPSRRATLTCPGGDAAAQALRGLMELARRPLFADPLRAALSLGPPSLSRVESGPALSSNPFRRLTPGQRNSPLKAAR